MAQRIFQISGTHCLACKTLIEEACQEIPGVTGCQVDYQTGQTIITYQAPVNWEQLVQAIEQLGLYHVNQREV